MITDTNISPVELSWTGLGSDDIKSVVESKYNPLMHRTPEELENPGMRELYLMSFCPEYIYFAAKVLLDKELSPMQCCMLYCLWTHAFPMLIGSRGLSKAISPDEKILTDDGWVPIKDIEVGDLVYSSSGNLCNVLDKTELQKDLVFYKLTLDDGREIECCEDHQWKVNDGEVKKTSELFGSLEKFSIDNPGIIQHSKKPLPISPYLLGVMVNCGKFINRRLCLTITNEDVRDNVESVLGPSYVLSEDSKNKFFIEKAKDSLLTPSFYALLEDCYEDFDGTISIPEDFLISDVQDRLLLVRGLVDSYVKKQYSNTLSYSEEYIAKAVSKVFRSLGFKVNCKEKDKIIFNKNYGKFYQVNVSLRQGYSIVELRSNDILSCRGDTSADIVSVEKIENQDGICIQVDSKDHTYITKDYLVTHNSFTLALYALLRAALVQGSKIVCVGAAFRQSKILYSYVQDMWDAAPVLRSIFKNKEDGSHKGTDQIVFQVGSSKIFFIPIGTGEKIRGLRGNIIIADEMNSLNTDIYEIVVNNFAAVSMNPIETMKQEARKKFLIEQGMPVPEDLDARDFKNQSIIAGTMGFENQPMYEYFQKYKKIIDSKGASLAEDEDNPGVMSYKDYCIMRLPYELIPKGFMDDKIIARAKATVHVGAYNSEYGCVPVKDTSGFFKRSLVESCVANNNNVHQESWPAWCIAPFDAKTEGHKKYEYVMGIDPAADDDNFAIVVLEVHPQHQRVVYSWTTNREQVKAIDKNLNYFAYCASHIRDLMRRFNISKIGIDAQGGGTPLAEALHDDNLMEENELPLWEEIDEDKPKDTDEMAGLHILKMIQFANAKWTSEANHSLRKDFESKTILFPEYDPVILGLASEQAGFGDESELSETIMNIEELKEELTNIIMETTATRERWTTPQVKTDSNKIGRLRKDRYSALIIANMLAREINQNKITNDFYNDAVGVKGSVTESPRKEMDYHGPSHLVKKAGTVDYRGVTRS